MKDGRPRFDVDLRERDDLADRFFDAVTVEDLDQLRQLVASGVEVYGTGWQGAAAEAGGRGSGQGSRGCSRRWAADSPTLDSTWSATRSTANRTRSSVTLPAGC